VPAVVIDGKLAACCTDRGINEQVLRAAGLATPPLEEVPFHFYDWQARPAFGCPRRYAALLTAGTPAPARRGERRRLSALRWRFITAHPLHQAGPALRFHACRNLTTLGYSPSTLGALRRRAQDCGREKTATTGSHPHDENNVQSA